MVTTRVIRKAYDATSQKKKRAALNRENHKRKTYGNGDGKDVAHTKSGTNYKSLALIALLTDTANVNGIPNALFSLILIITFLI